MSLSLLKGFSLFQIYILCADVFTCVYRCMYVYTKVKGQHEVSSSVTSPPYCTRQGLSLKLQLIQLDELASPRDLPVSLLSQGWDDRHVPPCLDFYQGARDLNSGPHAFLMSTIQAEPPSWYGSSQV